MIVVILVMVVIVVFDEILVLAVIEVIIVIVIHYFWNHFTESLVLYRFIVLLYTVTDPKFEHFRHVCAVILRVI